MAHYVIVGGHGKIALPAAPLLAQAGNTVTSIIRNPDQEGDVAATGATPLVLDIEHASQDELAAAYAGADAVIWSAGAGGGNPQRTYAVDRDAAIRSIDAAKQAGVRRYVTVSYLGASLDHGLDPSESFYPYAQSKAEADEHLRASGLDWTVLAPGTLTTTDPTGRIRLVPSGERDLAGSDTSRGNVARAIVAALANDATIGKTLGFTDGDTAIAAAFGRA